MPGGKEGPARRQALYEHLKALKGPNPPTLLIPDELLNVAVPFQQRVLGAVLLGQNPFKAGDPTPLRGIIRSADKAVQGLLSAPEHRHCAGLGRPIRRGRGGVRGGQAGPPGHRPGVLCHAGKAGLRPDEAGDRGAEESEVDSGAEKAAGVNHGPRRIVLGSVVLGIARGDRLPRAGLSESPRARCARDR